MWTVRTDDIPRGRRYRIQASAAYLTFREYFSLLQDDPEFAAWYTGTRAGQRHLSSPGRIFAQRSETTGRIAMAARRASHGSTNRHNTEMVEHIRPGRAMAARSG